MFIIALQNLDMSIVASSSPEFYPFSVSSMKSEFAAERKTSHRVMVTAQMRDYEGLTQASSWTGKTYFE